MVYVDSERCVGCGACVEVCPTGAIHLVEGESGSYAEIDQRECQECEACVRACPEEAIMSEVEPAIERELVRIEAKPVPARPQPRAVRPVRPVPKALTLLGAALAFAGREIVPRLAASLLDAWERRASRSTLSQSDVISVRPAQRPTTRPLGRGGHQRRWRQRRGQ
jgi:NAD-dependent dihydropyrimidine dehydrogenase PreA subunit